MARSSSLLTKKKVDGYLKKLPDWKIDKAYKKLSATFTFSDHVQALVFVARITVHAEVLHHHPDIQFSYKKVKVSTTTHDRKGLTNADVLLAARVQRAYMSG